MAQPPTTHCAPYTYILSHAKRSATQIIFLSYNIISFFIYADSTHVWYLPNILRIKIKEKAFLRVFDKIFLPHRRNWCEAKIPHILIYRHKFQKSLTVTLDSYARKDSPHHRNLFWFHVFVVYARIRTYTYIKDNLPLAKLNFIGKWTRTVHPCGCVAFCCNVLRCENNGGCDEDEIVFFC